MAFSGAQIEHHTLTIASGETASAFYDTHGLVVVGLILPTMTSTDVSFNTLAEDGETAIPIYDDTALYNPTIGSDRYVALDPSVMNGIADIQVIAGSSEGADRDIVLVMRPV